MTDNDETAESTYTAKQLARRLDTDPKTLRKFLRSKDSPIEAVGQGGRYEFDADAAKLIAKGFKSWGGVKPTKLKPEVDPAVEAEEIDDMEEPPAPKPKTPRRSRAKKPEPVTEIVADDDAIEELEIDEPTDADLEELDDIFEDAEEPPW